MGWDIELENLNKTRKGRPGYNFFVVVEHLVCVKHCSNYWRYSNEQSRQNVYIWRAHILRGHDKNK